MGEMGGIFPMLFSGAIRVIFTVAGPNEYHDAGLGIDCGLWPRPIRILVPAFERHHLCFDDSLSRHQQANSAVGLRVPLLFCQKGMDRRSTLDILGNSHCRLCVLGLGAGPFAKVSVAGVGVCSAQMLH